MKKVILSLIILIPLILISIVFINKTVLNNEIDLSPNDKILNTELDLSKVSKIQVVEPMGNPVYGADSKIIVDSEEIESMVNLFNSATIKEKAPDGDITDVSCSYYIFYNDNNEILSKFAFNGFDSTLIYRKKKWYYVTYGDSKNTPLDLYKNSKAPTIVVDEALNEMDRPSN